jgi:hypothetical protein
MFPSQGENMVKLSQPYFERMWGWNSHSRSIAGVKAPRIGVLFISLESYQNVNVENELAWPFGRLQHKLWQKEGSGVKLAVWFPTTKSRESTRPRCVQVECGTPLESSWGELQVCFRPHPDRRSEQRVMTLQSLGSPNQDSFGTPPWESWDKKPFGCGCYGEAQSILYGGRWWLPPNPGRGESCESRIARGLS